MFFNNGVSFSTEETSRIEPNAKVAGSQQCQSGFVMLASINGVTRGTIASPTVLAMSPRHVPPASTKAATCYMC
jgi:hypothetical protein